MKRRIKTSGCAVRTKCPGHSNGMAGFSYVEVLIAVVLIALTLVPAMDALLPGLAGSGLHEATAEDHYQLAGRLEQLLAEPFDELETAAIAAGNPATPTSYSDVITYPLGRQITRNVFLSRYDGDNADGDNNPFTDTDDGLLWVQVRIVGTGASIESLVSEFD